MFVYKSTQNNDISTTSTAACQATRVGASGRDRSPIVQLTGETQFFFLGYLTPMHLPAPLNWSCCFRYYLNDILIQRGRKSIQRNCLVNYKLLITKFSRTTKNSKTLVGQIVTQMHLTSCSQKGCHLL